MSPKHFRTHVQGESLHERINELKLDLFELFLRPFIILILLAFLTATYLKIIPITGMTLVTFAVVFIGFLIHSFIHGKRLLRKIRNCKKGLEGELYVGNLLNQLQSDSTYVFHDIVADGFNIDHLIVSTRGIFTVETKHYDRKKGYKFVFHGGSLLFNGRQCSSLLIQMNGQAQYMRERIEELTGKKYPIRKVALIVGSYVDNPDSDFSEFWILNEKSFSTFFEKTKEDLPILEVKSIVDQIRKSFQKAID